MSLAPKIDELRHVVQNANLDCICITESWLRSSIHDNVVPLEGYNIIRRDRVESEHGGVCMYIKDTINFTVLAELQEPSFEMLWDPIARPPFGLSDHASIELQPKERGHVKQPTITVKTRDLRPSKRQAMGTYLDAVDVNTLTCALKTCAEKVSLLEQIIKTGLDHILPTQSRRVHSTEPPWITSTLKDLIQARQRALSRGDNQQFRELRNRVNRERKACRAKYFQAKVEHLKECRPSAWWDEIKKLSGSSPAFTERSYVTKSLQHLYEPSDDISLANTINKAFLSPMQCFSPLPADFVLIPSNSATQQPVLVVSNESVYKKLTKLNRSKAHGPDGIPDTIIWKYVDDTTLVESVLKNESSYMQLRVNELVRQSEVDGFQFNESKCKELRISFSRSGSLFDHITINDKQIEVVSSARLLGVIVSDNLRWNAHVESICKKAAKRLYFLKQLKRAKVPSEDMLLFYTTCIRPVLEYACPVFHHSLPQYLSNEMERLQKRALRMIQPDLSYAEALVALDIASLYERREILCDALFDQIVRDENHKLHDLLPPRNESTYRTRSQRYFKLPICKTTRFKNTFIMANSFNY
ncbi:hypothetical protein AWC38_SpisGene24261 [Stylophora pistillata]|uniref:Alkylated DNA repair protein AlkB homologue 8 N-terminal domain-containing protein n=1 Tax=Stylophora pistillata TaxID=50429 RepID=A0A2B4R4Y2_STYPI|nr:hypothetical protein AWC38_SpisGene24261 [Stylophora pistillata]